MDCHVHIVYCNGGIMLGIVGEQITIPENPVWAVVIKKNSTSNCFSSIDFRLKSVLLVVRILVLDQKIMISFCLYQQQQR